MRKSRRGGTCHFATKPSHPLYLYGMCLPAEASGVDDRAVVGTSESALMTFRSTNKDLLMPMPCARTVPYENNVIEWVSFFGIGGIHKAREE